MDSGQERSHLFTVRLWQEVLGEDLSEVRFRVQHVLNGETRHYRDGGDVMAYIQEKLRELESAGSGNQEGEGR